MKALSIRQPWAWLILHGGKDCENRPWRTTHRGPLLIHASKTVDREAYAQLRARGVDMPALSGMPIGGIVGHVYVVDCVEEHESEWFTGPYALVLANPEPREFVPRKGRLGLFEVAL